MTTFLHPAFIQGKVYLAPLLPPVVVVTPVVTGVTIAPATITINGGLEQFVATSQGTNVANDTYTWHTTVGSIGSDGLLSVTATEVDQVGTVTATSVLDPTFSATANVTVLSTLAPPAPEIPSVMPGTQISMHFISPNGNPIAHTEVEIQLKQADFRDTLNAVYMPRLVTAKTDFDGRCLVKLMACDTPYYVTVFDPISDAALSYKFLVPESLGPDSVIRLQDILIDTELSLGFDEQALAIIAAAKADAVTAAEQAEADAKEIRDLFTGLKGPDGASKVGYKTGTVADALNTGTGTAPSNGGGGSGTGTREEVLLVPDDANVITPDGSLSNRFRFLLTTDTKIANPINFANNEHLYFTGYQDIVGGHKLTYGLDLLLPDAAPYAPPAGPKAAFLIEMRPTINMNNNQLNWTVIGYPDKSITAGFVQSSEIAYINAQGYYSLAAAFDALTADVPVRIVRNGKGAEATATKRGVDGETYYILGAPVVANGADQRPLLQLGLTDFGAGQPNRPAYGKAVLNFEDKGTVYVRDIRIAHARNEDSDARGVCPNADAINLILQNVEITDCNNGILTGNRDANLNGGKGYIGIVEMYDVRIDSCGMGGPSHDPEHNFNTGGFTHGTYFGHNDSKVILKRVSVTNAIQGDNIKCRTGTLIMDQVLMQNASEGRELEMSNGGVIHATNCIISRTFPSSGINNLSIIGNNSELDGIEGIDTSRPREYIFRNCRFETLLNAPGRDPHFIAGLDPTVPMQFIDCEFVGDQAKANQDTPQEQPYTGCVTKNGIRYRPGAPPIFTLTGGPIGPVLPVGYFPIPMTPIV